MNLKVLEIVTEEMQLEVHLKTYKMLVSNFYYVTDVIANEGFGSDYQSRKIERFLMI